MGAETGKTVIRYVITEMRNDIGLRSITGRPWNDKEYKDSNILKEDEKMNEKNICPIEAGAHPSEVREAAILGESLDYRVENNKKTHDVEGIRTFTPGLNYKIACEG